MASKITTHSAFLKFIYASEPRQRKVLIQSATNNQIDVLSEIALNVYRGVLELSQQHINKLRPYELNIRGLASRSVTHARKKKILTRKHSLIPLLIKPVLHLLHPE